jgi:O-antigen ligase
MQTATATSRSRWWGQALQNKFIALVLAMVVAVPLLASPADLRIVGIAALTFETFALSLAVTLLWRSRWSLGREQIATFIRTGANLPVLLLMGLALVSCAFAPNKMFAVQETLKLGAGVLLYFVVAYQFRQSKHLLMLVDALIFLAVTVSFLAMGQYTLSETALAGERGTALFGNQQPLGSLLMILLPVVAVMAITEKQLSRRQIAAQVATIMTAGALLLAHTRSAWIGAIAGFMVLAIVAIATSKSNKTDSHRSGRRHQKSHSAVQLVGLAAQKHKMVLPVMLAVVTLGFFAGLKMQNSAIFDRASTLSKVSTDMSFQGRVNKEWHGAIKMIQARPLTGWGVGQYPVYQHNFTGVGRSTTAIGSFSTRSSMAEQAHNFYLQTGAELGLPGLVLFLTVLGAFLFSAVRRVGTMDPGVRRSLLMGSIGAVAAFSFDAISSPSWQYGQVSMFFWLILGAGVGCLRSRAKQEEEAVVVAVSPSLARPVALGVATLLFVMALLPTAPKATAKTKYPEPPGSCGPNQVFDAEKGQCVGKGTLNNPK